jgi:light-regulated signal transduction histidine kinase (bacteriophytochrome)
LEDKRKQEKKRVTDQINMLKSKKAKLVSAAAAEANAVDGQIAEMTQLV